jgi:hypothetical protein
MRMKCKRKIESPTTCCMAESLYVIGCLCAPLDGNIFCKTDLASEVCATASIAIMKRLSKFHDIRLVFWYPMGSVGSSACAFWPTGNRLSPASADNVIAEPAPRRPHTTTLPNHTRLSAPFTHLCISGHRHANISYPYPPRKTSCRGSLTHTGMSTDLLRNDGSKTNIMTTTAAQTNSPGSIIPDHDAAMSASNEGGLDMGEGEKMDKKSWEYLTKSGLAGGFAGCAVRLYYSFTLVTVWHIFINANPRFDRPKQ